MPVEVADINDLIALSPIHSKPQTILSQVGLSSKDNALIMGAITLSFMFTEAPFDEVSANIFLSESAAQNRVFKSLEVSSSK